jgi:hypothetical protein
VQIQISFWHRIGTNTPLDRRSGRPYLTDATLASCLS